MDTDGMQSVESRYSGRGPAAAALPWEPLLPVPEPTPDTGPLSFLPPLLYSAFGSLAHRSLRARLGCSAGKGPSSPPHKPMEKHTRVP